MGKNSCVVSFFALACIELNNGICSSFIPVPWLNLMANLQERAGSVVVRLGGNTQEYAKMVDSLPDGNTFLKDMTDLQGTVRFLDLFLTSELVSN